MEYIALMAFSPAVTGNAKKLVDSSSIKNINAGVKIDSSGAVLNMPKPKEGVTYVVNALVFNALKITRNDIVSFDPDKAERDKNGLVIAQGGFITPPCLP